MKKVLILVCALAGFVGCQQPAATSDAPLIPEGISYLSREEWGANAPVLPMRPHKLTRLTIHHTGVPQLFDRSLTDKLRNLQKFSQEDSPLADGRMKPAWADVPYHLYVDVHGAVGEARDLNYAGDSNTSYDPAGHLLVVVEGNFEKEAITEAQLKTLEKLVPALTKRFGIPADSLGAHKDFAETSCPGTGLYGELPRFRQLVKGH
ncbi:peptidoglycan recognition protein family protein [Pontibacter lucknowensis]|uniref:N-acetylmuramoyl-L-alanine amidase n=1 Tax=Pontibacter lucknowensis TaxID=1077936 RepID=A0A1N7A5S0_9BACT|nr:peptidoglycan recognition family protein [Pontibacter lucknowensis]SIR34363.1 N-acetylmuramoyl-L-alanine amidase [Pontibacter lucknowensis]